MSSVHEIIVYAGPSLNSSSKSLISEGNIELRPPVKRGEIDDLVASGYRGFVAIADGLFREVLAVGHAELREAIKNGVEIYGLSSMGAIRAYEMRFLGMKGYGKVYDWFFKMEDFQDDEVALLHAPAPFYYPSSEPLVHFRECLNDLVSRGEVDEKVAHSITGELKGMYFGDRKMRTFLDLIKAYSDVDVHSLKEGFDQYRIKQMDLCDFLRDRPWMNNKS